MAWLIDNLVYRFNRKDLEKLSEKIMKVSDEISSLIINLDEEIYNKLDKTYSKLWEKIVDEIWS